MRPSPNCFGGTPWLLYAYTILCSALTVPLSQPVAGQWTAFAPWDPNAPPLFFLNDIGTSLVATALVIWYMCRQGSMCRWGSCKLPTSDPRVMRMQLLEGWRY